MATMRRVNLAALTVMLVLSGCDTITHYRNSTHPQFGQVDFDRDHYQCVRENSVRVVNVYNYGLTSASTEADDDMVQQCLAARGWHEAPN
jgi:hypothetical protein